MSEENLETLNQSLKLDSEEKKDDSNEISYYRPKLWKRCFALIFDGLILAFLAVGLFLGFRELFKMNSQYKENEESFNTFKLDSSLYIEDSGGSVRDIVTYYNQDNTVASASVEKDIENRIDRFFTFYENKIGVNEANSLRTEFKNLKLADSLIYTYEGVSYKLFKLEGEDVVKNSGITIPSKTYISFYTDYIDKYALGYFNSKFENVIAFNKYFTYILVLEVGLSLLVSSVIVYYVIPMCFVRNKTTLGRFMFKIGLVDKRVLSVKAGRFTIRFIIILFLEILLSIVTFGIPLIFSFSMVLITKKKQSFHDYLLGIEEIDIENSKIYKSIDEIFIPASDDDIHNFKLK